MWKLQCFVTGHLQCYTKKEQKQQHQDNRQQQPCWCTRSILLELNFFSYANNFFCSIKFRWPRGEENALMLQRLRNVFFFSSSCFGNAWQGQVGGQNTIFSQKSCSWKQILVRSEGKRCWYYQLTWPPWRQLQARQFSKSLSNHMTRKVKRHFKVVVVAVA